MHFGKFLDIFLREVVAVVAAVAEQTYGAGGGKALAACLRIWIAECRVGLDAHSHGFVDRDGPGSGYGVGGHQHKAVEALRLHDGPLDSLKSADRAADEGTDMADAERIGEDAVGVDNIADGVGGEVLVIRFASCRIGVERRGGAVGRSENVGADDEIFGRVEEFSLLYCVWPPVLHIAVAGQGVTHPDNVALVGVECAVGVICDAEFVELSAKFQCERCVMVIIVDHYVLDLLLWGKVTDNK